MWVGIINIQKIGEFWEMKTHISSAKIVTSYQTTRQHIPE